MSSLKNKFQKIKKAHLQVAGLLLLILLSICLLWINNRTSLQSESALMAQVYFDGEYRIGDGDWERIVPGEHIPSTKGDVTLRGNLHMCTPYGEYVDVYRGDVPIAFYVNHINLTFREVGSEHIVLEMEDSQFGDSMCGKGWVACFFMGDPNDNIEITVHNPHRYGNETAIDEMLASTAFWAGMDFEKDVLNRGEPQRNVGMLLMLVSIVLLGIALFSSLIHIKNTKII